MPFYFFTSNEANTHMTLELTTMNVEKFQIISKDSYDTSSQQMYEIRQ